MAFEPYGAKDACHSTPLRTIFMRAAAVVSEATSARTPPATSATPNSAHKIVLGTASGTRSSYLEHDRAGSVASPPPRDGEDSRDDVGPWPPEGVLVYGQRSMFQAPAPGAPVRVPRV